MESLKSPSINHREYHQVAAIAVSLSWMDPIISFILEETLLDEQKEAKKERRKSTQFWLLAKRKLYRRSFGRPYLSCVHPEVVDGLLAELHEGIYGSHTGGQSFAYQVITQGYWWPNMQKNAAEYVKKCDQCQRHAPSIH